MPEELGDDLQRFLGDNSIYGDLEDEGLEGDENINGRNVDQDFGRDNIRDYIEENVVNPLQRIENNQATQEDIETLEETIKNLDFVTSEDLENIEDTIQSNNEQLGTLEEIYLGLEEAYRELASEGDTGELKSITNRLEETLGRYEEILDKLEDPDYPELEPPPETEPEPDTTDDGYNPGLMDKVGMAFVRLGDALNYGGEDR